MPLAENHAENALVVDIRFVRMNWEKLVPVLLALLSVALALGALGQASACGAIEVNKFEPGRRYCTGNVEWFHPAFVALTLVGLVSVMVGPWWIATVVGAAMLPGQLLSAWAMPIGIALIVAGLVARRSGPITPMRFRRVHRPA